MILDRPIYRAFAAGGAIVEPADLQVQVPPILSRVVESGDILRLQTGLGTTQEVSFIVQHNVAQPVSTAQDVSTVVALKPGLWRVNVYLAGRCDYAPVLTALSAHPSVQIVKDAQTVQLLAVLWNQNEFASTRWDGYLLVDTDTTFKLLVPATGAGETSFVHVVVHGCRMA